MTAAPSITVADKLACAKREIRQRHRVYPRLVEAGRMTEAGATREIAIMQAIADDYEAKALAEQAAADQLAAVGRLL